MNDFEQVRLLLESALCGDLVVSKLLALKLVCHLHLLLLLRLQLLKQNNFLFVGFAGKQFAFVFDVLVDSIGIVEVDA